MSELDDQKCIAKILDKLGVLWFHPPNEAKRSYRTATSLRAAGMKRGVPDIMIMSPPPAGPSSCRGVAIELKHGKRKATPDQRIWIERLRGVGWEARCCQLDEAIEWLRELGYLGDE